jgi:Flp pilus assembly pilin Flp
MKTLLSVIKSVFKDEKGSMTVEIMVIMALIGVIASAVFTTLNTGLSTSAGNVSTKVQSTIDSWGTGS